MVGANRRLERDITKISQKLDNIEKLLQQGQQGQNAVPVSPLLSEPTQAYVPDEDEDFENNPINYNDVHRGQRGEESAPYSYFRTLSCAARIPFELPNWLHREMESQEIPFALGIPPPPLNDMHTVHRLIESFFDNVHRWFPFLDRDSWTDRYSRAFDHRSRFDTSYCMYLLVLALGSMAHPDGHTDLSHRWATEYAQSAFAMMPAVIISSDLTSVHCLILFRYLNFGES